MPILTDRPRSFARQLRQLAASLAADGCRLTEQAREELGLIDTAAAAASPARTGNAPETPPPPPHVPTSERLATPARIG